MGSAYKTPEYYHCIDDARLRDSVYEPEADTFLFLAALDKDQEALHALSPRRCVEVGCGSGTVITHLFAVMNTGEATAGAAAGGAKPSPTQYYAVDVNPIALEATALTWQSTLRKYFRDCIQGEGTAQGDDSLVCFESSATGDSSGVGEASSTPSSSPSVLHLYCGDLLSPLPPGSMFDVVLFNPPYVPTSLEELQDAIAQKDVITAAWCGGPRGRVVLDRFLRMLPKYLSRDGVCYLVLIKENDEEEVAAAVEEAFREHCGWPPRTAGKAGDTLTEMVAVVRRYTGEHLSVHRISYKR